MRLRLCLNEALCLIEARLGLFGVYYQGAMWQREHARAHNHSHVRSQSFTRALTIIHTCAHNHSRARSQSFTRALTIIHVHAVIHVRACVYLRTLIYTCARLTYIFVHTCITHNTHICAYARTYTNTQTHTRTHARTGGGYDGRYSALGS